jgi:hypothetical protein
MRAGPDLLGALGCSHGELDLPPVDLGHLGLPGNQASNPCRREMAHVDGRADRALAGIETVPKSLAGVFAHCSKDRPVTRPDLFLKAVALQLKSGAKAKRS